MTDGKGQSVASDLPLFLAHAIELESEAAGRYDELADSMDVHNNREVAELFRKLAEFSCLHRDEIAGLAAGAGPLPVLAPWEFDWMGFAESPEAAGFEQTHYLMTPRHALRLALDCERHAQSFDQAVAQAAGDGEVARLAGQFAAEEAEHVEHVTRLLARYPEADEDWDEDPDPPNYNE